DYEADVNEYEANGVDYFEFEQIYSNQQYEFMHDFAKTVEDLTLRGRLLDALNRSKPFRNFQEIVRFSDSDQDWFDYLRMRTIEAFRNQIAAFNGILSPNVEDDLD
ncbi:MAG: hypothetical protein RIS47_623, partial [Bacteroidota bacterium]